MGSFKKSKKRKVHQMTELTRVYVKMCSKDPRRMLKVHGGQDV